MRKLLTPKVRLFLAAWIIYSAFFATNVVREHYPAFSIIDDGTFRVDEYLGFHPDIFQHRDGHSYIGNQVAPSVIAALPLFVFKPVLNYLEDLGAERARARKEAPPAAAYRTEYPNRQVFLTKVRERGLDLKFGAATAITSAFLMAPLTAFLVVLVFSALLRRGVAEGRAFGLAVIFAFGTPVFYRTAYLTHNVFVMAVIFFAWLLLRDDPEASDKTRRRREFWSGFCGGTALALDYAGVIPLLIFWVALLVSYRRSGWLHALWSSRFYVLGSVPPVLFLVYSQWAMYGHPFLPGQYWMPDVNFTDRGWRGYAWPTWDLFVKQFLDPNWGLLTFGPLLVLGFLPVRSHSVQPVTSVFERRSAQVFIWVFIIFCTGNQYSLMTWNTGFRYLLPVVPLLFLMLCEGLRRWPAWLLWVVGGSVVLHTTVLSMVRFTPVDFDDQRTAVGETWRRFLAEGVQLPWLNVLRQTSGGSDSLLHAAWLPCFILFGLLALVIPLLRFKTRR